MFLIAHAAFRQRLSSLHVKLMETWQETIVTRAFDGYIAAGHAGDNSAGRISTGEHRSYI